MTDTHVELSVARWVARLSDINLSDEALVALVNKHYRQIDKQPFWSAFSAHCKQHALVERITRVSELCLANSGDNAKHLTLIIALIEAAVAKKLSTAIRQHLNEIDDDVIHTLLATIHDNLQVKSGDIAAGLLQILKVLVEQFGFDHYRYELFQYWLEYHLVTKSWSSAQQLIDKYQLEEANIPEPYRQVFINNQGLVLLNIQGCAAAIAYYQSVLAQSNNGPTQISLRQNLAVALLNEGRYIEANQQLTQLLDYANSHLDEQSMQILGNLQVLHTSQGRKDKARDFMRLQLEKLQQMRAQDITVVPETLATCYFNATLEAIAETDADINTDDHVKQVESFYRQFEAVFQYLPDAFMAPTRTRLKLEWLRYRQDTKRLKQTLNELTAQFSEHQTDSENLNLMLVMAGLWLSERQQIKARQLFERVMVLAQQTSFVEIEYIACGYLAIIAFICEKPEQGLSLITQALSQEMNLRQRIDSGLNQIFYSSRSKDIKQQSMVLVAQKLSAGQVFDHLQRVKTPSARLSRPAVTYSALQLALGQNSLMLEYYIGENLAFCLCCSQRYPEPIMIELDDSCFAQLQQWQSRFTGQLDKAISQLFSNPFQWMSVCWSTLFEPVASMLIHHDDIVIAPGNALFGFPLHIVPTPAQQLLIENHSISYVTSASCWFDAQQQAGHNVGLKKKINTMVLVEQCESRFGPSPLLLKEAIQVAQILRVSPLIDSGDSINQLAKQQVIDICHIGCHGSFNPDLPLQSGLWLAQDGQDKLLALASFEQPEQQIARQLLFLSGCDTGRSSAISGEETLGLGRMIQMQQTATAILSLWPVCANDPNIVVLITRFYDNWLHSDMPRAEALRQAMLSVKSINPYYWACYGLFGYGG